jgi:hypothetical protein
MGVSEKRDPVRRKRKHLLYGLIDGLAGLMRQAVKHIAVDRPDAACAYLLDDIPGLLEGLLAVDRLLDLVIEILHPDGCAGHADLGERVVLLGGQIVGVHLDADFRIRIEAEPAAQHLVQCHHVLGPQHCRRTAAKVQCGNPAFRIDQTGNRFHLVFERGQVSLQRIVPQGLLCVAAAEPAKPIAPRNVDIQGQRLAGLQAAQPACIGFTVDASMKMRGGGVAGVARSRATVLADEIFLHLLPLS